MGAGGCEIAQLQRLPVLRRNVPGAAPHRAGGRRLHDVPLGLRPGDHLRRRPVVLQGHLPSAAGRRPSVQRFDPCGLGLYCDLVTTQTCRPLVPRGGTCNPQLGSQDCSAPQDFCDPNTSVCTPPLAVGSACGDSSQPCLPYATCDVTIRTCVAQPTVGATCDRSAVPSCLAGDCDYTSATCVLPAGGDGACS